MLEQFSFLLREDEIETNRKKYVGKMAGRAWKYSQNIDGLIRTRIIIFLSAIYILVPIIIILATSGEFPATFAIERFILALIIIAGGLLFNKARILGIIIASLPLILIALFQLFSPGGFDIRLVGILMGLSLLILSGIFHNYRTKKLRSELEHTEIINSLN